MQSMGKNCVQNKHSVPKYTGANELANGWNYNIMQKASLEEAPGITSTKLQCSRDKTILGLVRVWSDGSHHSHFLTFVLLAVHQLTYLLIYKY